MKVYIFRCRSRSKVYAATRYETGSNLPADQCSGGWDFHERVDLGLKSGTLRFAVDVATLQRQLLRNGWYVWDESPRELRQSVAAESKPVPREQDRPPARAETAKAAAAGAPMRDMAPSARPAPVREAPVDSAREAGAARNVAPLPVRHQVVWFDIPVRDLDRAVRFYSAVLGTQLKKEQAGPGAAIAVLPHADGAIGGCLLQNADARPSESGPLLYLNTSGRLDEALNAVERHGGRVLLSRHSIAPFGFRAIVLDSEGNRIALQSA